MAWRGRGRGRGAPPTHSSSNGADTEPEGPPPLFPVLLTIVPAHPCSMMLPVCIILQLAGMGVEAS